MDPAKLMIHGLGSAWQKHAIVIALRPNSRSHAEGCSGHFALPWYALQGALRVYGDCCGKQDGLGDARLEK